LCRPGRLSQALWDAELDASIVSAPAISDGTLYVGTINGTLYALDAPTGDVLWQATLDGGIWGTPALPLAAAAEAQATPTPTAGDAEATPEATSEATPAAEEPAPGGTLYIGTAKDPEGGTLYAIDTTDGSTIWTVQSAGGIASSPVFHENIIYFVTDDGMIRAVNADKTPAWQQPVEGKFYTTPVVAGDLLLVAPTNNNDIFLAAYTLDGDQKWIFSPNKK
jgi:outer membrane protein assembly factor BamB